MKQVKNSLLVLFVLFGVQLHGQTNAEKALALGHEAVELMDNGDVKKSLKLLAEAQELDPTRFDYPYETAYANYLQEEYKKSVKILESIKFHKDVTDQLFQLLGNSYDMLGQSEKAFEIYNEGLRKFPNAGSLYLEKGNVHWNKKQYDQALPYYEQGIEADPSFPSNYYRAARIYCASTEEVWGMLYGEIFMNLERNSQRTAEISKLLYDTYKSQISIGPEGPSGISFCKDTVYFHAQEIKGKWPFGNLCYEPILMISLISQEKIDLTSLDVIRSNFVDRYFEREFNDRFPNALFDYQKTIKDAGHMESYNHWILMKGDEEAFGIWIKDNKVKWDAFVTWFMENGLQLDENHRFYKGQYE
jgi:tetratricopeptide (TPR) repeat protein